MGSSASQKAVGPYMAVPPQNAGQAYLSLPAVAVGTQIGLLVLERLPQPLNQNVVVESLSSGPADPDLLGLQPGHELRGGELAPLVRVENLWLTAAAEGHLQGIQAELRVKAVRELPAVAEGFSVGVHGPGEEIHDCHQAWKTRRWITWHRGAGLLVDRP